MSSSIQKEISQLASPTRAKASEWYFKTGKGQYGYGDIFIGLTVPQMRILAKKYSAINFGAIKKLLHSKYHEQRLIALLILVSKFTLDPERVYKFYLSNTKYINNWDLVDLSAPKIVGVYLQGRNKNILNKLAKSKNLWERRIAILATFQFIYQNYFDKSLEIAKMLLVDKHDLIHKAVGWMLREVGKRDEKVLINFLDKYKKQMPRTTLRYAIERFPETKRKFYLKK